MSTITTDEAGLLHAILSDVADDVPRLLYADWLEDQGQEKRAEFIRLQLEVASQPPVFYNSVTEACFHDEPDHYCYQCRDQRHRATEILLRVLPGAWSGFPAFLCERLTKDTLWSWRRGFVRYVALPLASFLEHSKALFSAQPIEEVRLTDCEPQARQGGKFCWLGAGYPGHLHYLHPSILDCLPGRTHAVNGVFYDSRAEALAGLSVACVRYGRRAAGLSP